MSCTHRESGVGMSHGYFSSDSEIGCLFSVSEPDCTWDIIIFKIRKLKSVRGGRSTIAVEAIAVETIAVEAIAVEMIAVEAITVHPGGSIDNCCWGNHCWDDCCWGDRCWDDCCWGDCCWDNRCWGDHCWDNPLLRWSLLRRLLFIWGGWSMIAVEAITVWSDCCWEDQHRTALWVYLDASWVMLFAAPMTLRCPVFAHPLWSLGIYWEKSKEDRLVHNHEISVPPPDIPCEARGWPLVLLVLRERKSTSINSVEIYMLTSRWWCFINKYE